MFKFRVFEMPIDEFQDATKSSGASHAKNKPKLKNHKRLLVQYFITHQKLHYIQFPKNCPGVGALRCKGSGVRVPI